MAVSKEGKGSKRRKIVDLIAAILLSAATVGSAWSAYQATRWSGVQAIRFSQASAARVEASRISAIGAQLVGIDVGMFVQYAAAVSQDNMRLAEFLRNRFRPPLKRATDAWQATRPLKNPEAPPSPFAMKEYHLPEQDQVAALTKTAERRFEGARTANQTSDNYVLITVVFAAVLFFSGVGPRFEAPALQLVQLGISAVLFLVAASFLLVFPVH